jgi:glycosyltransferase involved in cell wall biosynthesis
VRNAANELAATLDSIVGQSYPNKEIIVIDGASTDATLSVIESYNARIDYWCSEPDQGPYDAMNKAAALAHGHWIIYINAGDSFVDRDALARCLAGVREDADFVAAHHVYISPDGIETIHRCVDFERSYRRLLDGDTSGEWLAGIPGHQATLTRVDLIREYRYDLGLRIAADHEFMYRMRRAGAVFHIEPVILSQYRGGGLSWQNLFACLEEWRAIALRYTEQPKRVERCFSRLQIDMLRMTRRLGAFDWRREPARKHPLLAAGVTLEFHVRVWLGTLDRLYARTIQR